jgi:hypothetical protein
MVKWTYACTLNLKVRNEEIEKEKEKKKKKKNIINLTAKCSYTLNTLKLVD